MAESFYQVGGSLPETAPTYAVRRADTHLYEGLRAGEFCYVLSSRQMGKSSLIVRAVQQLRQSGIRCATIDLSDIGNQSTTLEQWYGGVAYKLLSSLDCFEAMEFMEWWRSRSVLSPVQRLSELMTDRLLQVTPEPMVIVIDEIDSVLSCRDSLDDFFALIRSCYNKRAQDPIYQRLTFALVGVATPRDLIADPTRTPFNIGRAIELQGLTIAEAQPLIPGLAQRFDHPQSILTAILDWTGGQPFLTQKLCSLAVTQAEDNPLENTPPAVWVDHLVRSHLLDHWEAQDEPTHFKTIRDRLTRNPQQAGRLLGLYEKILQHQHIPVDDTPEQAQLCLSGLVIRRAGYLQPFNRIYQAIFDAPWVETAFFNLRPYAEALTAWMASDRQDSSRLLRGQALEDALQWSAGKSLGYQDYQFLAASQDAALTESRQREEESRLALDRLSHEKQLLEELNHVQEERERAEQQLRSERQLRLRMVTAIGGAISSMLAFLLGVIWVGQSINQANTQLNELSQFSLALLEEGQPQEALRQSIKAGQLLKDSIGISSQTRMRVILTLQQAVNRLSPPVVPSKSTSSPTPPVSPRLPALPQVTSPDQKQQAIAQANYSIELWSNPGVVPDAILTGHRATIRHLQYSPNGQRLASVSLDGTVRIWDRQGHGVGILRHPAGVVDVAYSPDGSLLATASVEGTIRLWHQDGTLLTVLEGHHAPVLQVTFAPNGQAFTSIDQTQTEIHWSLNLEELLQKAYALSSPSRSYGRED